MTKGKVYKVRLEMSDSVNENRVKRIMHKSLGTIAGMLNVDIREMEVDK